MTSPWWTNLADHQTTTALGQTNVFFFAFGWCHDNTPISRQYFPLSAERWQKFVWLSFGFKVETAYYLERLELSNLFSLLCEEILSQKSHWHLLKVVVVVIATAAAVAVIAVVVVFIVFVVPVIWLLKKLIMKWNLIFSRVILKLMHSFETSRHLSFPKAFKGFKASHQ